jgi:hypothetical protein
MTRPYGQVAYRGLGRRVPVAGGRDRRLHRHVVPDRGNRGLVIDMTVAHNGVVGRG